MKKLNLWALAALIIGATALAACSSSSEDNGNAGGGGNTGGGGEEQPTQVETAALSGIVFDDNGNTLANVTVENGTASTTTGANGVFTLQQVNVVNGRAVLKFKKSGFIDIVRSMPTTEGEKWEVVMTSEGNAHTVTYAAASSQTIGSSQDPAMTVELPANGYKVDATGAEYTGQVTTSVLYLDPDDKNFAATMPGGDLAAVRTDGSDAMLVSYGMVKVDMKGAGGEKLQLKDGEKATLTFPIPDTLKTNTPPTIPLRSFNEQTGLWEEEGTATLQGNVYVGQVSHFSWVNLDHPDVRATIRVWVNSGGKAVANTPVHIGQVTKTTNSNGFIETYIPQRTAFDVTILPEDFGYYSPQKFVHVSETQATSSSSIVEVRLDMPTLTSIKGRVVNKGTGSSVATVWLKLAAAQANIKKIFTSLDGQFELYGPATYRGPADIVVELGDGSKVTKTIYMDGSNFENLSIEVNSNANGQGGMMEVNVTGGTQGKLALSPMSLDDMEGVIIEDGVLIVQPNHHKHMYTSGDVWESLQIDISGYKDNTTQTDTASLYYSVEGNGEWKSVRADRTLKTTIARQGTSYTFTFSSDKAYYTDNQVTGGNLPNATIKGEYTAPLLAKTQPKANLTAGDVPAFMPLLAGKENVGLVITESPALGKGAVAVYGDKAIQKTDFENLKKQATASLGAPYEEVNADAVQSEWDQQTSYARYFKDGQYLEIMFTDGYTYDVDNFSFMLLTHERGRGFGRLSVTGYSALTIPLTTLNPQYYAKRAPFSLKEPWRK